CLADGVVCVGASNTYWWRGDSWEDDEVAKFSSRGPIPWGRIAPTLAAPGVRILSAILSDVDPLFPGAEASGTSMATPHVSGALALLIEYNRGRGAPTSPDYLIKLLSQTARPLRFWAWTPTPMDQGSGQINVYAAATSRILVEVDGGWSSSKIAYGSSVSFNIKITNLDTANVRANINASLIEVFEVFEEEVPQAAIMFDKTVIAIDPGESVIITLTVNVETLKPGTYAGYVVIYDGERYYRAPISVFVPFKAGGDGSVRANLGVLIGKSILLLEPKYDLWPDWNIIGIYVESPLKKPVAINVWNAHMGDPGRPTILLSTPDKATAALPFSGFIFNSPGLYIIIAGYYQLIYPDIIVGNAPMYLRVIVETLEVYEPVAVEEARELIDMVKALEERVSKLEDKIGILESRITALKTKVIELEGMFTVLIERLSGLRDRLEYINSTLSSIEIKISQSESDIKTLKANIKGLEARLRDISIDIGLIKNAVTIL
ncbi:MAG: S8 family serine peptidase, partial [Acidilobaceae archaeon]